MRSAPVGISACLLGRPVRYDGGHKREALLADVLARSFEWVPVCPESECGLGVPREPMQLEGSLHAPRLVTIETRVDLTERMLRWARLRVGQLEGQKLAGFVFKCRSPSCGLRRHKPPPVFDSRGQPHAAGTGLFARIFAEHFPLLPLADEESLRDPAAREEFIARILRTAG